jgi:hypothetical protein
MKTVGISGYISTGSSAFVDLLHEFDETQVLDPEFLISHFSDGLETLEYNLMNGHHYSGSIAIKRFKKIVNFTTPIALRKDVCKITDEFLDEIVQLSWEGSSNHADLVLQTPLIMLLKKIISKLLIKSHLNTLLRKNIEELFHYKLNFSIMPENFEEASKLFIKKVLTARGINYNNNEKNIVVLNQSFQSRNPVKSFKFFENPVAIIVDRDPRDHYLFCKFFLSKRMGIGVVPYHNIDHYIKHYRLMRRTLQDLRKREDIMFFNFEELVYDCENTTKKFADFVGVTKHVRKGECFKPTHSRNNTQLFKKYIECEADIKKIEQELSEYLFPFEKYPDIESEGGMFYGSQIEKGR